MQNIPYTHAESIDVFVKCIQQTDALDDHVIYTVHIELHFQDLAVPFPNLHPENAIKVEYHKKTCKGNCVEVKKQHKNLLQHHITGVPVE